MRLKLAVLEISSRRNELKAVVLNNLYADAKKAKEIDTIKCAKTVGVGLKSSWGESQVQALLPKHRATHIIC